MGRSRHIALSQAKVFAALFERFSNWATEENGAARSAENIRRMLDEAEHKPKQAAHAK